MGYIIFLLELVFYLCIIIFFIIAVFLGIFLHKYLQFIFNQNCYHYNIYKNLSYHQIQILNNYYTQVLESIQLVKENYFMKLFDHL